MSAILSLFFSVPALWILQKPRSSRPVSPMTACGENTGGVKRVLRRAAPDLPRRARRCGVRCVPCPAVSSSCWSLQVALYTLRTCQRKQTGLVLRALLTVKAQIDGFPGWMDICGEFGLEGLFFFFILEEEICIF